MGIITGFIGKYFLEALVVIGFGIVSKVASKYLSSERWLTIKEMVLTSMLWAEETYGIGNGGQKWTKAWQKVTQLLKAKGITIKEKEIPLVTDLMKSNIPEINYLTYSALPPVAIVKRDILNSTPEYRRLADILKNKHSKKKEMKQ